MFTELVTNCTFHVLHCGRNADEIKHRFHWYLYPVHVCWRGTPNTKVYPKVSGLRR